MLALVFQFLEGGLAYDSVQNVRSRHRYSYNYSYGSLTLRGEVFFFQIPTTQRYSGFPFKYTTMTPCNARFASMFLSMAVDIVFDSNFVFDFVVIFEFVCVFVFVVLDTFTCTF